MHYSLGLGLGLGLGKYSIVTSRYYMHSATVENKYRAGRCPRTDYVANYSISSCEEYCGLKGLSFSVVVLSFIPGTKDKTTTEKDKTLKRKDKTRRSKVLYFDVREKDKIIVEKKKV